MFRNGNFVLEEREQPHRSVVRYDGQNETLIKINAVQTLWYVNCHNAWLSHGLMENVNKLHFGLQFSVQMQRKGLLLESTMTCDDMLKHNKDDLFWKERSRTMKNGLIARMRSGRGPGEKESIHRQSFKMWSESVQGDPLR